MPGKSCRIIGAVCADGSGLAHAQSGSAGCSIAMMKNRCPVHARPSPQNPRDAARARRTNRAAPGARAAEVAATISMAPGSSAASGLLARAPAATPSSSPAARLSGRPPGAPSVPMARCTAPPPATASRSSRPAACPVAAAAGRSGNRTAALEGGPRRNNNFQVATAEGVETAHHALHASTFDQNCPVLPPDLGGPPDRSDAGTIRQRRRQHRQRREIAVRFTPGAPRS